MDQLSKKEIRAKVEESVSQTLAKLEITNISKKTKKAVKKTTAKLAKAFNQELKKISKRIKKAKKADTIKSVKPKKSVKAQGKTKAVAPVPAEEAKIAS